MLQEVQPEKEDGEGFDLPLEDISPERDGVEEEQEAPVDPYTDFVPPGAHSGFIPSPFAPTF